MATDTISAPAPLPQPQPKKTIGLAALRTALQECLIYAGQEHSEDGHEANSHLFTLLREHARKLDHRVQFSRAGACVVVDLVPVERCYHCRMLAPVHTMSCPEAA